MGARAAAAQVGRRLGGRRAAARGGGRRGAQELIPGCGPPFLRSGVAVVQGAEVVTAEGPLRPCAAAAPAVRFRADVSCASLEHSILYQSLAIGQGPSSTIRLGNPVSLQGAKCSISGVFGMLFRKAALETRLFE